MTIYDILEVIKTFFNSVIAVLVSLRLLPGDEEETTTGVAAE